MVKLVKLITGEELICEMTNGNDGESFLFNCFLPIRTQQGIALAPYPMLSKENKVIIKQMDVLFSVEVNEGTVNAHREACGGIIAAKNELIL